MGKYQGNRILDHVDNHIEEKVEKGVKKKVKKRSQQSCKESPRRTRRMTIKICVISPTSHLQRFSSLGEMDMSLTHLILEDTEYARYYKEQSSRGRYILLDNSAYELEQQGKGLDPDPVLDAAETTNPSEVIATDVLFKGQETIESTKDFVAAMRRRDLIGKYKVMGVVQGSSREEWFECLEGLLNIPEVDIIGLSKLSIPMSFLGEKDSPGNVACSRLSCTEEIKQRISLAYFGGGKSIYHRLGSGEVVVHLLGADNWCCWEMQRQASLPWIRSNDSSCATWYGAHQQTFNDAGKIEDIILEKPDLENHNRDTAADLDRHAEHVLENIARWHMACKGDVIYE